MPPDYWKIGKKRHFICSNLTLFIVSFFLFFSFFFLFFFFLGGGGGRRPPSPPNDAPGLEDYWLDVSANQAREIQFSLSSAEVRLMTSKTRYSPRTSLVANPGWSRLEEISAGKSGGRQHIHVWRTCARAKTSEVYNRKNFGPRTDPWRRNPPPTIRRGRRCSELGHERLLK